MSGKGLPIVLKLDNEHEQTEKDWERYEELLAAEQERALSLQFLFEFPLSFFMGLPSIIPVDQDRTDKNVIKWVSSSFLW